MNRWLHRTCIFLAAFAAGSTCVRAQTPVLIKEVQTREYSVNVGSVQTPLVKQTASREFSIHIENGPDGLVNLASRETSFVVSDSAAPPVITELVVTVSPTGDSALLDWSGYNQWEVGDIDHFEIYLSDAGPFTDSSSLTPYLIVPGGNTNITLQGLTPFVDHFFAVVAVDALGNREPAVLYSAAYVLSPEAISREVSFHIERGPPNGIARLESRELSLLVSDASPPPPVIDVAIATSPTGDSALLDWSDYNQWNVGDIERFDIYLSDAGGFTDVTGLTPYQSVRGGQTSVFIDGLTSFQDHFFAVVPVDGLGNFDPLVDYGAAYVLSPEAISREVTLHIERGSPDTLTRIESREHSLLVPDPAIPAPVTGLDSGFFADTSTTDFGAVVVDWTNYNEALQVDVIRYAIYVGNAFFDDVTGLSPFGYVPAGTQRVTQDGLPGGEILHFAVVAEDLLGGFDPVVRSFSTQVSVSGVGEVINLAVTGDATSLNYSWEAPPDTSAFLAGYNIYFGGATSPVLIGPGETSFAATGLTPATGYSFRITTRDVFGNESPGNSIVAATLLPNPASLTLTAQGGNVVLQWTAVTPSALVKNYAIYESTAPITDITGLSPLKTAFGTTTTLGTFAQTADRFYAVATVNISNASDPTVTSIQATKTGQTINFPSLSPGPLLIPLNATASSNLPVRFTASPSLVATINGSNLVVKQGGTVVVKAIQDGDATFWPAEATQSLRLPPVIESFTANAAELTNSSILTRNAALQVVARDTDGFARAEFFGRFPGAPAWTSLGIDSSPSNGLKGTLPVETLPDGPYEVRVLVTTSTGVTAERMHPLTVNVQPVLTLALGNTVEEGSSLTGQVSIQRTRGTNLIVTMSSSRPNQLNAGPPVTIPAGQTSANFTVLAPQDLVVEGFQNVTVHASVPNGVAAEKVIMIADDDVPVLTLALSRSVVPESAGPNAVLARVTRDNSSGEPLTVLLTNSDPTAAVVPSSVTIPSGQSFFEFPIGAVDDDVVDGDQTTQIRAEVRVPGVGTVAQSAPASLLVGDDEGPTLELVFANGWLLEGQSGTVTLRRTGGPVSQALTVQLSADLPAVLQVPAQIDIPVGASEVPVIVTALDNGEPDGSRRVIVTGTAPAHGPGEVPVEVNDETLPDLVAASLGAPPQVKTEQEFRISYRIENHGAGPATGPSVQRIYLSDDPLAGADQLVSQYQFAGPLAPGSGIGRSETIRAPREAGTYWLVVITDATDSIEELLESNNTTVLAQPIVVGEAYTATVATSVEIVPANTPIPLTGTATLAAGGPAAFRMVNIHIRLGNSERIIAAITNSLGQFSTNWQPLPGEGGDYEIGASHPGTPTAPTQDTFTILTIQTAFPGETVLFDEGSSATITGTLTNPTNNTLTGLTLAAPDLPDGLSAAFTFPGGTLAAGQTIQAGVAFTAAPGFFGEHSVVLLVTTDQGIELRIPIQLSVRPLLPQLVLSPEALECSVVRGTQKTASLHIENTGGAESGPIQVLLPPLPWLSLASPATLPSLPPGASADVTLRLEPGITEALGQVNGNLIVRPANGADVNLPFAFRIVSDLMGDLQVAVSDEYTYFTAGAPKVEGATVDVLDPYSGELLFTTETGPDGLATFTNLLEGWYTVEVDHSIHTRHRANYFVNAGELNTEDVFISLELVTYNWTVEEIEIQDRYRISVITTFETNVPAPVVTVTPAVLDVEDLVTVGQQKVINLTLENHGFIASQQGRFAIGTHPYYEITPLISDIGTLPAKSALTIPVTITRIAVPSAPSEGDGNPSAGSAPVPCSQSVCYVHGYWCGPIFVEKCERVAVSGVEGNCPGSDWYPYGEGGGQGNASFTPVAIQSSPTSCLAKCWFKIMFELVWKLAKDYIPNWAKCAKSVASAAAEPSIGKGAWAAFRCACTLKSFIPHPVVQAAAAGICDGSKYLKCLLDLDKCLQEQMALDGGPSPLRVPPAGSPVPGTPPSDIHVFSPGSLEYLAETDAALAEALRRNATMLDYYAYIYGSPETYAFAVSPGSERFNGTFLVASWENSAGGHALTAAELTDLRTIITEDELDSPMLEAFLQRWQNTIDLSNQGIVNYADAPPALQNDFIAQDILRTRAQEMLDAVAAGEADGFRDPFDEVWHRADAVVDVLNSDGSGVCAIVKVQIDQEAVMTRSAFRATLELTNNLPNAPLTGVRFDLNIRDTNGQPAEEVFGIRVSDLSGLPAIDGSGDIDPLGTGRVQWTLLPSDAAAPLTETTYSIGGTISYNQDGVDFSIPVASVDITVRPDAALYLKYFHQRDVFSDDPHTSPIEAAIPYSLAVLVENRGAGPARDLQITSAQPEIIDNEKGLFIDFSIIGTEVAGQNLSPSLTADFGTIAPGESKVGTWLLTSTLQGNFVDYEATFEHLDGFGDPRLSLIKEVEIHEMIHLIEAQGTKADGLPDFLVNDVADINNLPDTVHRSDGPIEPVTVVEEAVITGDVTSSSLSVTLNATIGAGWSYLRIPDPADGNFQLLQVLRSDGLELEIDRNAWVTDRTFIGLGRRPIYENILHLADCDSTGQYTLFYQTRAIDSAPPESMVAALPAQSSSFIPLTWTGSDDTAVASFDVFVSEDGGPWILWLGNTTRISSVYQGQLNRAYAFYSQATDLAGNVEVQTATADASTIVGLENAPPILDPLDDATIPEGSEFLQQVQTTDPDGPQSGLRYSITASRSGFSISPTGRIRWVTGETDGGTSANVTVTVRDSGFPVGVASRNFTVTVQDVNSPPQLTPLAPQTLAFGQSLSVQALAIDIDNPTQTLQFSLGSGSPSGASINPTSGLVTWTPLKGDAGQIVAVEVIATDNGTPVAAASTTFSVTVSENPDLPPVFHPLPVPLWFAGETQSLTISAFDPDGDPVTLTGNTGALSGSAGFAGTPGSGQATLTWDIPAGLSGIFTVPLTASANGTQTLTSLAIRVEERDDYWSWAAETMAGVTDPADYGMFADPDGDLRVNINEFAVLTNPLKADHFAVDGNISLIGPWVVAELSFHRRAGSQEFVALFPTSSPDLTPANWTPLNASAWDADVDPRGDEDNRPESEAIEMTLYQYYPEGIPNRLFFGIEMTPTP